MTTAAQEEPLKLRDQAYRAFTRHLLARDIRPGQFVSQRELVEVTGMPLGAIRELIPRLEADGLIVTVPQRGMQIAHIDLNLIRNAFQLRLILEREAAAHFVATASDDELARLRREHEAILEAAQAGVTRELIAQAQAMDWAFHDCLIDALGNEIISNVYRVNSVKIRLIRQELIRLDDKLVIPVFEEHLRIISVFETRDVTQSVEALAQHIASSRNRAMRT